MARVLLVLPEDDLGGSSIAALRAIEPLRARGWDVRIWCSTPSALHAELVARALPAEGVPRLMRWRWRTLRHPPGLRARLASLPRSLRAFRSHLRSVKPDLVCANGRLALPEALIARACGIQVVAYIHDAGLPGLRGVVGRVAPWLAAHEVIAVSHAHARALRLGRRRPRIVPESGPRLEAPARQLKAAGARPVVGTIGVISHRKGIDLFIDMAAHVASRGIRAEFRIAGAVEDGPAAAWAKAQLLRAQDLGIQYLGQVDVAVELRSWDVMVLASRADPFPLVVLEAMASGVAVVGSSVDGIVEQLEEGGGVLVAPEDPRALADAVVDLLVDPQRLAQQGAAGHRRVISNFTPERSADALERVWLSVLGDSTTSNGAAPA